jgi:hypothetical protein
MTVRVVRTEDPAEEPAPPLRLIAPVEPAEAPPEPKHATTEPLEPALYETPMREAPAPPAGPNVWQAAAIQAVAITTALAAILSIRFALILAILCAAGLTAFAEAQPEHQLLAVVAAGVFTVFGLIPMVALALRERST